MANKTDRKQINPMTAGVVGAVAGAIGGAAAVALSDQSTREKVTKKITELKDQAVTKFNEIKDKSPMAKKLGGNEENVKKSQTKNV